MARIRFQSRMCNSAPSALRLLLDDLRGLCGSWSSQLVLDCEWATKHWRAALPEDGWFHGMGHDHCVLNKVARSLQDALEVCMICGDGTVTCVKPSRCLRSPRRSGCVDPVVLRVTWSVTNAGPLSHLARLWQSVPGSCTVVSTLLIRG